MKNLIFALEDYCTLFAQFTRKHLNKIEDMIENESIDINSLEEELDKSKQISESNEYHHDLADSLTHVQAQIEAFRRQHP